MLAGSVLSKRQPLAFWSHCHYRAQCCFRFGPVGFARACFVQTGSKPCYILLFYCILFR